MLFLIRAILIFLIIILVIRAFKMAKPASGNLKDDPQERWKFRNKSTGIPKEIGDYTDYEEIEKK